VLSHPSLDLRSTGTTPAPTAGAVWPFPTSHPTSFRISPCGLYLLFKRFCATDRMRSLLFHRLLSQHPVLPTPEGPSRLFSSEFGDTSGSLPLLLPSPCVTGSALSCSPYGANISVLHDSLYAQHYVLRAVALLSLLRRLQRFGTPSHPACYLAA